MSRFLKLTLGLALTVGLLLGTANAQELAYDPNDPGAGGQSIEPDSTVEA